MINYIPWHDGTGMIKQTLSPSHADDVKAFFEDLK